MFLWANWVSFSMGLGVVACVQIINSRVAFFGKQGYLAAMESMLLPIEVMTLIGAWDMHFVLCFFLKIKTHIYAYIVYSTSVISFHWTPQWLFWWWMLDQVGWHVKRVRCLSQIVSKSLYVFWIIHSKKAWFSSFLPLAFLAWQRWCHSDLKVSSLAWCYWWSWCGKHKRFGTCRGGRIQLQPVAVQVVPQRRRDCQFFRVSWMRSPHPRWCLAALRIMESASCSGQVRRLAPSYVVGREGDWPKRLSVTHDHPLLNNF